MYNIIFIGSDGLMVTLTANRLEDALEVHWKMVQGGFEVLTEVPH